MERRRPPAGCVHHSDRGSQYAARSCRDALSEHGLVGSMDPCGDPYDNAEAESFMQTLEVEAVYPMAFETFGDAVEHFPRFIEETYDSRRLRSAPGYMSPRQFEDNHAPSPVQSAA